jgi:hypothetical protein
MSNFPYLLCVMLALSAWWLGSFPLRRDRAADFLEAMRSARRILENMIAHFRGPGDSELVGWFSSLKLSAGPVGLLVVTAGFLGILVAIARTCGVLEAVA